jgi:hypothetical protein
VKPRHAWIVTLAAAVLVYGNTLAQPAPAAKLSVWNIQVTGPGGQTKLVVFGGNPNVFLPTCRCIAGVWTIGKDGESATHFTGTLQDTSPNHTRAAVKAKGLSVKVRKTRYLMSVSGDHRAKLHAIIRGSGQIILREVTGGEWEIAGYSEDPLGDLFANNPRWRADPKSPPKATAPAPILDPAADGVALAKVINDYRASIGLPRLPVSPGLTKVAQAHVRDLNVNKPVKEGCNMHSWSANGTWTACCYDASAAAARCMWKKPKEIGSYRGNGYEIAAKSPSGMTPELALLQWQGSPAHHEVMINKGKWTQPWGAFGVAVEGDYSVAWFGNEADPK